MLDTARIAGSGIPDPRPPGPPQPPDLPPDPAPAPDPPIPDLPPDVPPRPIKNWHFGVLPYGADAERRLFQCSHGHGKRRLRVLQIWRLRMPKTPKKRAGTRRVRSPQPLRVTRNYVRRSGRQKRQSASASLPLQVDAAGQIVALWWSYPLRLAACRSPFDLWREHARFSHQVLLAAQTMPFGRPFAYPPHLP